MRIAKRKLMFLEDCSAVLEFIQRDANPGINATIRDRYFNSACATPASVFPILIKLKNSHMKKIERESCRNENVL
ncbi:MAG: type I-C CRISPR-associated protein Cas8c/Csd1 [Ruminococcus sp.]